MIVTLTPDEIARARKIAEGRNNPKESTGVRSKKWTARYTELEAHLIGACGELAGAKALCAKADEAFMLHGDNGVDAEAYGHKWQIKSTPYAGKDINLTFNSEKDFRADAALLVRSLSLEKHEVIGIISRKRFFQRATSRDYGYGKRLIVPGSDLKPLSSLKGYAEPKQEEPTEPATDPVTRAQRQSVAEWVREYEEAMNAHDGGSSPSPIPSRPSRGDAGAARIAPHRG
jgi:hypothetical protein